MECHECDREAVGKCRRCGRGYCGGHGADLCRSCAVAIVAGAPPGARGQRLVFLQCENRPRMPTIYLDDDDPGPPSCHICEGLARTVCESCHQLYCPEHAGRRGWCEECTRTSRVGLYISFAVFGCIAVLFLVMYLFERLHH
jgi:hypothetical protein